MLDILVFAIAVAITKRVADRHPLLPSSSTSTPGMPGRAQTRRRDDGDDAPSSPSSSTQISRRVFQITLLISLLLLSLSVLEASPAAWLAIVIPNGRDVGIRSGVAFAPPLTFVGWYRALLWAMCATLLVMHPLSLCTIFASPLLYMVERMPFSSRIRGEDKKSSMASSSPSSSSSSPSSPLPLPTWNRHSQRRGHRATRLLMLCWNILRIGMRLVLVTLLWRLLLRRMLRAMIPYRITRRESEADEGGSGGGGGMGLSHRLCTAIGVIAFVAAAATMAGFYMSPFIFVPSLARMVSALCLVGTMVASVLNGFGCASLPHANLVGMLLESTPPALIAKVEKDWEYAIKVLEEKRWQLADGMTHPRPQSFPPMSSSSSTSFLTLLPTTTTMTTAEIRKARKQLEEEIIFLTNLTGDMEDDLCEMKSSSLLALEARTAVGRVRGILGVVFSLVLIVRVLSAAAFLLGPAYERDRRDGDSSRRRDPLTSLLLLLVGRNYIASAEQYERFSQVTSLVLAGALTTSQVSTFFRVVGALGRRLRGTFARSSLRVTGGVQGSTSRRVIDVAVLTSSFMMGCFFLACVTVIKTNLPIEYQRSFSTAVGSSNLSYFNSNGDARLTNMVFCASSCISAITLASLFGIQRNNSDRYRNEFSQLLGSSTSSFHSSA